jgi:L-seryl-tRNA(Ser) seleniumtransferase
MRANAAEFGEGMTKSALRSQLHALREQLRSGSRAAVPDPDELAADVRASLVRAVRPIGRRAINASGIILHPWLARAAMCTEALDALAGFDRHSFLPGDTRTEEHSQRDEHVEAMLCDLTGCEAATVVNNNAAATMLALNTLARGKEVVIARGQLIELGGTFRVPEIVRTSGCLLRAVGTTNRTHLRDYEDALGQDTGALMRVHASHCRIHGFAAVPGIDELGDLARRRGVPLIDDLGSGALVSLRPFGLPDEPLVADSISRGADVVCFSGDKLIGGPQAGLICGRRDLVARIRANPLARMLRVCKMTVAALQATLPHFVNGEYARRIPLYRSLSRPLAELDARARELAAAVEAACDTAPVVSEDRSFLVSDSELEEGLPTMAVRLAPKRIATRVLAHALLEHVPAVLARVTEDAVTLDVRTVEPGEVGEIAQAVSRALAAEEP